MIVEAISAQLLAFGHATANLLHAVGAKLVAIGDARLLAIIAVSAEGLPVLMLGAPRHAEVRTAIAVDPYIGMAAALEGKGPVLALRAAALHAEGTAVATAPALHPETAAIAAAVPATRLEIGVATTAAAQLGGTSVGSVPAVTTAGLCAHRRRNRQSGDARGKE